MKYKNYTTTEAGALVHKDHATAIHGAKDFEKSEVYQTAERAKWKKRFLRRLFEMAKVNSDILKRIY